MAQKKRLTPNQKAELKGDLAGLKTVSGYKSAKAEFNLAEVVTVDEQLDGVDEQISQAEAQLADLRNQAADLGASYTQKVKGMRQQIVAQFGDDSPEYETVGVKRTSNRKTPARRGKNGSNVKPNG